MKHLFSASLIAIAVAACGGGQSSTDQGMGGAFMAGQEDGQYNAGLRAYNGGDLASAEILFGRALDANPNYLAAHLSLGSCLLDMGRYQDAHDSFASCIALRSSTVECWIGSSQASMEMGNTEGAISEGQSAVDNAESGGRNSLIGEAYGVLGVAQLAAGDLTGATTSLETALRSDASNIGARIELARLYVEQGREPDAVSLLSNASSYTADIESQLWLGTLFFELGIYDRALDILMDARTEDSNNDDVLYYISAAHLEAGNRDMAYEFSSELVARSPSYLDGYIVRGRAQLDRGLIPNARNNAQSALAADDDHFGGLVLMADVLRTDGDAEDAVSYVERAHAIDGDALYGLMVQAAVYYDLERFDDYITLIAPEMGRSDRGDDWLARLSQSYRELDRVDELIATQRELADANTRDYGLRRDLVRLAIDNPGIVSPDDIVTYAETAFERSGNQITYRVLYIEALANADRIDEAIFVAEDALESAENPTLREWLERLEDM